jgi:protein NRD1
MLTAEYGGTGGKPIEGGMVVEEPDIEIGQGVSSKAISRRMQTDKGGNNGPKSSRDREDEERQRYRRPDRRDPENRNSREREFQSTAPPPVPGFPYNMPTLPNGMPMFPPGFQFPGQTGGAPGRSWVFKRTFGCSRHCVTMLFLSHPRIIWSF